MTEAKAYVRWFEELRSDDVPVVGGKNASLGEMIHALKKEKIRVPDGFATTAEAYREFLKANVLTEKIRDQLGRLDSKKQSLDRTGKGGYGALVTASVLGAFALAFTWLQLEVASAVTVSFLTLAFAQLWHVFNMRDRGSGFWRNDITRNAFVWGALALCVGLLLAAVYVPGLALILKVERLDFDGWFLVVAMSLLPWIIGQLLKSRLTETAKSMGLRGGRLRDLKT